MTNNLVETNDGESRNVRIAKLLGYTVERREGKGESGWAQGFYFVLRSPNGVDMMDDADDWRGVSSEWYTEAEAWQHAPDFEHSCDASLATLPDWTHVEIHPVASPDEYPRYHCLLRSIRRTGDGVGTTRAEALAEARKAMLMAKQETNGAD